MSYSERTDLVSAVSIPPTMATAWYKSKIPPKLLGRLTFERKSAAAPSSSIEVWKTTCIVTNLGKPTGANCRVLINPGNQQLSGVSKFPYFPKGGPVPKEEPKKDAHHIMGYVTQWGGMDIGNGMLFPFNVVDGMVHQLGGWRLAWICKSLPTIQQNHQPQHQDDVRANQLEEEKDVKCPIGSSVRTLSPTGTDLHDQYDEIVHTVPPFYKFHPDPEKYLKQCYMNSLSLASKKEPASFYKTLLSSLSSVSTASSQQHQNLRRIACPLLGAGGRGFPEDVAIKVAAEAAIQWYSDYIHKASDDVDQDHGELCLAFGIPEMRTAESLLEALSLEMKQYGAHH